MQTGGGYIDLVLADHLAANLPQRAGSLASVPLALDELTMRERDVLRLIAWGYSNKEIAARLDISVKTVEYYKAQATEKLHLRGRIDIVRYALSRGWLQSNREPV